MKQLDFPSALLPIGLIPSPPRTSQGGCRRRGSGIGVRLAGPFVVLLVFLL